MSQTNNLTPSLENYLETILFLEKKNRVARVKDIAEMMNVQMPSVTGALKNLKARELINYQKNSYISLTDKGLDVANAVQNRHTLLSAFLEKILALSREDAEEEACKIEHVISPETAHRIRNLTTYIEHTVFEEGGVSDKKWHSILGNVSDS